MNKKVVIVVVVILLLGVGAFLFIRRRRAAKKKEEEAKAAAAAEATSTDETVPTDEDVPTTIEEVKDEQSIEDKKKEIEAKFKASKPTPGASPEQFADAFFEIADGNKDDVLDENELSLIPDNTRTPLMMMEKQSKLGLFEDKKLSKQEMISLMKKMNNRSRDAVKAKRVDAPKKAIRTPIYKLRDAQTNANDWGGGNMIFLDRHTLDCGDDGLNQFKLVRPKGNQIQYKYKCLDGINSPANINKNTGANDWGGGNTIFLDRHNVDCAENPIAKFRLVRPRGNQIRYDYTCNSKKVSGACRDVNTGWNQESNQQIYLDRHDVKCNDNEVITKFKLNRDGKGKFRYDYKCCEI